MSATTVSPTAPAAASATTTVATSVCINGLGQQGRDDRRKPVS
jgi:hypothetical protein